MSVSKVLLTAEEFDNFPFEEDKRYELDEGELIEMTRPAFDHNAVLMNLLYSLEHYRRQTGAGTVLLSENLYALAETTRRAPDAAIVLGNRRPELKGQKVIRIIPEIVAEVLSPSETRRAIHRKLKQYFAAGVKEAWIINPESRDVEIWSGPQLPQELAGDAAITSPLLPGFSLPLSDLFA